MSTAGSNWPFEQTLGRTCLHIRYSTTQLFSSNHQFNKNPTYRTRTQIFKTMSILRATTTSSESIILRPTTPSEEGVLLYLPAGCRAIIECPLIPVPSDSATLMQIAVHAGKNVEETDLFHFWKSDLCAHFVDVFTNVGLRGTAQPHAS